MEKNDNKETQEDLRKELEQKRKELQKLKKKTKNKAKKAEKKADAKKAEKKVKAKKIEKKAKAKKIEKKVKAKKIEKKVKAKKIEKKEPKPKKLTKAELKKIQEEEAKRKAEEERTYEEELQEKLSEDEIENFTIAKLDMNRLIAKVCEILLDNEEKGMLQTDVWKKLKLNTKDGSRLSLKMEKMGYITRQKILMSGRWTYTLFIEKAPISFESITNAPCLTCTVEQKCSLENELPEPSPRNCDLIEKWVLTQYSRKTKKK